MPAVMHTFYLLACWLLTDRALCFTYVPKQNNLVDQINTTLLLLKRWHLGTEPFCLDPMLIKPTMHSSLFMLGGGAPASLISFPFLILLCIHFGMAEYVCNWYYYWHLFPCYHFLQNYWLLRLVSRVFKYLPFLYPLMSPSYALVGFCKS